MTATRARKPATPVDANLVVSAQASESNVQKAVMDCFTRFGFLVFHTYDSRLANRAGKGFPDLVAVGCGRTIFVEMKKQSGKRSAEQIIWASAIRETPAEYYVWRPLDWRNGTIERIISGHLSVAQ